MGQTTGAGPRRKIGGGSPLDSIGSGLTARGLSDIPQTRASRAKGVIGGGAQSADFDPGAVLGGLTRPRRRASDFRVGMGDLIKSMFAQGANQGRFGSGGNK
jgi:hypothetical protein